MKPTLSGSPDILGLTRNPGMRRRIPAFAGTAKLSRKFTVTAY